MKLSVITVSYNAQDTIEKTINSILNQTYKNIELVIIDGGSTDGTINIIKKYRGKISYYISEQDNGIYHAMDKGIKASTGDVLYFLNCGDEFYDDGVVKNIIHIFEKSRADIVFGDLFYISNNEKDYFALDILKPNTRYSQAHINNKMKLYDVNIHHQTVFYRRKVFNNSNIYLEKTNYGSDYILNVEAIIKNNYKAFYTDQMIAKFLLGGVSTDKDTALDDYENARNIIREKFFKNSIRLKLYKILNPAVYIFLSKNFRSLLRIYDTNKNVKRKIDCIINRLFCWGF